MDNRELELLMRKKAEKATKFLQKIEKFYKDKGEQVNLQEIIRIPGIMLYFQNRAFVKEFLEMTKKAEREKLQASSDAELDAKLILIDSVYNGYLDLMNAIDASLTEINPQSNPIEEMFLVCALMRMGINTMVKMNPNIGGLNANN